MSVIKLRRLLVSVHLILAAFLTPAFILVAVTGGLELADIEGKLEETPLSFPDGVELDFKGPDLEEAVDALLEAQGISIESSLIGYEFEQSNLAPNSVGPNLIAGDWLAIQCAQAAGYFDGNQLAPVYANVVSYDFE